MKGLYVLMSFHGCVLSWLTTIHLDQGNDRSFDIYYYNFPMGTYLKYFINVYRCVCWMKSTSIDGLDVPYIRPCHSMRLILLVLTLDWKLLQYRNIQFCTWIIDVVATIAGFTSFNTKSKKYRVIPINTNNLWSYFTFLISHWNTTQRTYAR